MDFTHTRIRWQRPFTSYAKVRVLLAALLRNRAFQLTRPRVREASYLDIGCGPKTHRHLVNLDYQWHPDIDVCWDVTRGLPFAGERFSGVFTEHCIEHLPLAAVDALLRECKRVLKPGGAIRIVVPDGELYLTRYVGLLTGSASLSLPYAESDAHEGMYTPMMSVNRIFCESGHRFIQDFETLSALLAKNGFRDIKREAYRSGRDPQLLVDSPERAVESLYVEAAV